MGGRAAFSLLEYFFQFFTKETGPSNLLLQSQSVSPWPLVLLLEVGWCAGLCTWLELQIPHCPCCDLKSELVTRCSLYLNVSWAVKRGRGGKLPGFHFSGST